MQLFKLLDTDVFHSAMSHLRRDREATMSDKAPTDTEMLDWLGAGRDINVKKRLEEIGYRLVDESAVQSLRDVIIATMRDEKK